MTAFEKYEFFRRISSAYELYGPPIGFGETAELYPLRDVRNTWKDAEVRTHLPQTTALYVHVPFCLERRCTFCMYKSMSHYTTAEIDTYVRRIQEELDFWQPETLSGQPLSGMYVGGGTPNVCAPMQLHKLLHPLAQLSYATTAEKTCELAASSATTDHIAVLCDLNFNRISIGIQSFEPGILRSVNRAYATPEMAKALIAPARASGFVDVNVDLMIGLPGRTAENVRNDIRRTITAGALSISLYVYRNTRSPLKPDEESRRQESVRSQLAAAVDEIARSGWAYDAGNADTEYHLFTSPERKCRTIRFRTSMNGLDNDRVIGLGTFAHGFSPAAFYTCEKTDLSFSSTDRRYRIGYLSTRQQMQTAVCNMLYANGMTIQNERFKHAFGCSIMDVFPEELSDLRTLGKLIDKPNGYTLQSNSRDDAIALQKFFWDFDFLRRLAEKSAPSRVLGGTDV